MTAPTCKKCGNAAIFLRTRYFETEDADVWECRTSGCESCGLIIAHTSKPKTQPIMDTQQLITALNESADDLDARSTVSDTLYAAHMRNAADLIVELKRARDFWQAERNNQILASVTPPEKSHERRFQEYVAEENAVQDIARHWNDDEPALARNRLAAHVRQVAVISANAEHAVILVEQAAARARLIEQERSEIIERIRSWCASNGVPASVVAA